MRQVRINRRRVRRCDSDVLDDLSLQPLRPTRPTADPEATLVRIDEVLAGR